MQRWGGSQLAVQAISLDGDVNWNFLWKTAGKKWGSEYLTNMNALLQNCIILFFHYISKLGVYRLPLKITHSPYAY